MSIAILESKFCFKFILNVFTSFVILDTCIWITEFILIGLAVNFWIENRSIELWVTPSELQYFDATFSDHRWTLLITEIIEIDQYTDAGQDFVNTFVVLASGERKQLTYSNFSIDRMAFVEALKKASKNIKLPQERPC